MKRINLVMKSTRLLAATVAAGALALVAPGRGHAQGVTPVLTSVRITDATLSLIDPESGASSGTVGSDTKIAVGDVISFRMKYFPVPNKILRGLGGYLTILRQPRSKVAIASSERTSYRGMRFSNIRHPPKKFAGYRSIALTALVADPTI